MKDENSMGGSPPALQDTNSPREYGTGSQQIVAPAAVRSALWANIPAELRDRPQWCITPGADTDKAPRTVTGAKASSTDPSTWTNFDAACNAALERGWHIGYVFTEDDPFACIDFDVCDAQTQLAKGQPEDSSKWTMPGEMAAFWDATQRLDSYAEVSRSGKGLHVIVKGNIGKGIKRPPIEIYSEARFLISTGDVRLNRSIKDQQAWLDDQVRDRVAIPTALAEVEPTESDETVIEKGRASSKKFDGLWRGEWQGDYPSQSEADYALLGLLATATPSDAQIRRIFRQSGLGQRKKARRDKYINYALEKFRASQATTSANAAALDASIDAALADRRDKQRFKFKQIGEGESDITKLNPPTMDLDMMLHSLVHVYAEQTYVAFRDMPAIRTSEAGMRSLLAHNTTKKVVEEEGKIKKVEIPTFNIWKVNSRRIQVYTLTFDPRYGEVCSSPDGRPALNLWRPTPHVSPPQWQNTIQPFLGHMAYLVPADDERERLLDWLAHIEQAPGELPHHHYLMIATEQGIGRNWLSSLLACVWPGHVALDFNLVQSLSSGFNGQLSRKLLANVDEINEGGKAEQWAHSEKLKSMVTARERFINVKYGLQHAEHNCCRWLLFSNYESALPLHDNDRRWNVIRSPGPPRDPNYYAEIYKLLDDPQFAAAVREYLRTRSLTSFNPGARAIMNEAKEAVVAMSQSPEDERATELVRTYPRDLILAEHLFEAIFGDMPSEWVNTSDTGRKWKLLPSIASKAGIRKWNKNDVTLFGKRNRKVWILRNPQRWRQVADPRELEQELSR